LHDDVNEIVNQVFTKGSIVTDDQKELCKKRIREYFATKGNLDCKVNIEEIVDKDKPNSIRLVFDIDRGKNVKVEGIYFVSSEKIKPRKLRKAMKNTKGRFKAFKRL